MARWPPLDAEYRQHLRELNVYVGSVQGVARGAPPRNALPSGRDRERRPVRLHVSLPCDLVRDYRSALTITAQSVHRVARERGCCDACPIRTS